MKSSRVILSYICVIAVVLSIAKANPENGKLYNDLPSDSKEELDISDISENLDGYKSFNERLQSIQRKNLIDVLNMVLKMKLMDSNLNVNDLKENGYKQRSIRDNKRMHKTFFVGK